MKKLLITGIDSGLGRHLWVNLPNSTGLSRNNIDILGYPESYDVIIHCAFNKRSFDDRNIISTYNYLDDNLLLTEKLLDIPHKKFIYISSIDVYTETNDYARFKKYAEALVLGKDPNALILRCSMMLGDTMKPNHVTKLKTGQDLTLSPHSHFNYILMDDLVEFVGFEEYNKIDDKIVDFVANGDLQLEDLRTYFKSDIKQLGSYIHDSQQYHFKNPIWKLNPKYDNSSMENIKQYFENE